MSHTDHAAPTEAPQAGTQVEVDKIPDCDLCKEQAIETPAVYDAKTQHGPWAYLCEAHFTRWGIGLGVGQGQRLILRGES